MSLSGYGAELAATVLAEHPVVDCAVCVAILATPGRLHRFVECLSLESPVLVQLFTPGKEQSVGHRVLQATRFFNFLLQIIIVRQPLLEAEERIP